MSRSNHDSTTKDVAFRLGPKVIGPGFPCFVIAEAGSNHDGDLDQAKSLIDVASRAGADAVKFQAYVADHIAARTSHPIAQIDIAGTSTLHELYKSSELPREWLGELKKYAEARNLVFLCTPFDEESADILDGIGTLGFKVASFEMTHLPLLRHLARMGKPILLSTGLSTLGEIEESLEAVRTANDVPVGLFHCGSQYPLEFQDVNLRAMETMHQALRVPVGYSDHTLGIAVPIAAVARGAHMLEKHFTLSRELPGPDHGFALEPDELDQLVAGIRAVEAALGSPRKGPSEHELINKERARRSIFADVPIAKGTVITADMLAILRPGVGLPPKYLDIVVGHTATRNIEPFEPITWEML